MRLLCLSHLNPTWLRINLSAWRSHTLSPRQHKWHAPFGRNTSIDRHKLLSLRPPHAHTRKISCLLRISVGIFAGAGVKLLSARPARCHIGSRPCSLLGPDTDEGGGEEAPFDWDRLWKLVWPHFWQLAGAVVAAVVVALLNIQIPQLLGSVVNVLANFSRGRAAGVFAEELHRPARALARLYVLQAFCTFWYIYLLSCVGEKIATQMKQDLFSSIMRQDIAFFDTHRTGDIMSRLTTDIQNFKSSFKLCVSQGLRSVAQIVGCTGSLLFISPHMTWGLLLVLPVVVIAGTLLGSVLRRLSRQAQEQACRATMVGGEAVGNIRTVRAFAMEGVECSLFNHETEEARKLSQNLGFGIGLFQAASNLFLNGMVLGTLYAGGCLLSSQQVSPGDLMVFLVASQTIQRSLANLSQLLGHVATGLAAGCRVFELTNLQPTIPLTGGLVIPAQSLMADVEFQNVTFSYPSRPNQMVLKDFNLKLEAGQTVAVVGASGNGKSTIALLLERFYDVDGGSITVDGIDIRELDPSWLRGQAIGYIDQEPVLFAGSVMDNIRYGNPCASDKEVIEVSKLADADDFIRSFPDGYSTVVGDRGVTISGGQKQRIAIARALLKNPSIIILDEATSALDAESEKTVQTALERAVRGRTVLVIAHRLSTVQNADLIVVLNNGVIVEMGSHEVLKLQKGLYWNLIRQQEASQQEHTYSL